MAGFKGGCLYGEIRYKVVATDVYRGQRPLHALYS